MNCDTVRIPEISPTSTVARRVVTRVATSTVGIWVMRNVAPHVDPTLLKVSRGRLSMVAPFPALLLAHTGVKSGLPRTSTIVYFTDRGRVIVIASNFGSPRNPAWYYNVKANPEVRLDAGRFSGTFLAEEMTGTERDRLYALAQGATSPYGRYQDTAGSRLIPVVAFTPIP
jgi:deazaflavin-dependent oxidoreductase (nitroreductase family)